MIGQRRTVVGKRKYQPYSKKNKSAVTRYTKTNTYVDRMIAPLKWQANSQSFVVNHNLWTLPKCINDTIVRGTGSTQRIGDTIRIDKYALRMRIQNELPDGTEMWTITRSNEAHSFRIVIVYDKQPNSAVALSSQIFDPVGGTILQYNNLEYRDRFVTLLDKTVTLNQGQSCGGVYEFYMNPKLITQYGNSDAGSIGNIKTGSILMTMTAWQHAALTESTPDTWQVDMLSRYRYTDE